MSDTEKSPSNLRAQAHLLNLRDLRELAHLSRETLAVGVGLSTQALRDLESGMSNPRLATVYVLVSALAGHLEKPANWVFEKLIPDAVYAPYEPLREAAALRLGEAALRPLSGSAARRRFTQTSGDAPGAPESAEPNLYRLQQLFARSRFSQAELADLTGLTDRTLRQFFGANAPTGRNTTLAVFLTITAALAPVLGGSVKDAVLHVLADDLARLGARPPV